MKRFALLLLVLALFAPRAAWAVHTSDHDPIAAESAEHVHHHGHSHEATAADAVEDTGAKDWNDGDQDSKGLTHQHPPNGLLAFAALLPGDAVLEAPSVERMHIPEMVPDGIRIASPELQDRPPRTA
jgi:hypothetical protein